MSYESNKNDYADLHEITNDLNYVTIKLDGIIECQNDGALKYALINIIDSLFLIKNKLETYKAHNEVPE